MTTILMLTIIVMSAVVLVTAGCALWLDRNESGRLARVARSRRPFHAL